MTELDTKVYKDLKEEFIRVSKKIIKEKLSKNGSKLEEYKSEIIISHNALINYIKHFYPQLDVENKVKYRDELKYIRGKIIKCFEYLQINYNFHERLLTKIGLDQNNSQLDEGILGGNIDELTDENLTLTDLDRIGEGDSETDVEETETGKAQIEPNIETKMTSTEDTRKFISLCASTLNQRYGGDPLGLASFLSGIELLESIAGEHTELLIKFIKTRLEGKALESIPTTNVTIASITNALKDTIKPDSSKVVEGKILSLRFNPTKPSEFTTEATELAEAFQRSLIVEGIPQAKAKSMAVEKTVDLCRRCARSSTVKAILASKEFSEPSEVIAKLIVEGNNDYHEKQILSIEKQQKQRSRESRGGGNGRGNYNGQSGQGGQHGHYNNRENNHGGGSGRGRGRGYNNGYNGGNGSGYNNSNQRSQYVRTIDQGNEHFPSSDRRDLEEEPTLHIPYET